MQKLRKSKFRETANYNMKIYNIQTACNRIKEMSVLLGFFSYYQRLKILIIPIVNKVNSHLWGTSFLIFVERHLATKLNRSSFSDHESQGETGHGQDDFL